MGFASRASPLIHPRLESARQEDSPFKRTGIVLSNVFTRPRDIAIEITKVSFRARQDQSR